MAEEDASELFVSDANRLRRTQTGVTHYSAGGGVNITAAQVALTTRDVYWNLPPVFLGNMVRFVLYTQLFAFIISNELN